MNAYMKIVDKTTPVHGRYIGQEVKLTTKTKVNKDNEVVGDYTIPLYRQEVDNNLKLIQDDIKELRAKYQIDELILE